MISLVTRSRRVSAMCQHRLHELQNFQYSTQQSSESTLMQEELVSSSLIDTNFTFLIDEFRGNKCYNFNKFPQYFNNLPYDQYLKNGDRYRQRRHSKLCACTYLKKEQTSFIQTKSVNSYAGELDRKFEEIDDTLLCDPDFIGLLDQFRRYVLTFSSNNKWFWDNGEIGIHQIRIIASLDGILGEPTPEGIHQDGFDFVQLMVMNRDNVKGGKSRIYFHKDDSIPVVEKILPPGFMAFMNDRKVYHSAQEIKVKDNQRDGVRDVFVFTFHSNLCLI